MFVLIVACYIPLSLHYFFIPVMILIFFDGLLLSYILPFIKIFILNIRIDDIIINKELFFLKRYTQDQNTAFSKSIEQYHEHFIFHVPVTEDYSETSLKDMKNFIWILTLSLNYKMKHYIYIMSIITLAFFFFIVFYKFYFDNFLHTKKGFYVFIFLSIWVIYIVIRLQSVASLRYFEYLFNDYQEKIRLRPLMNYLSISKINMTTQMPELYTVAQILEDTKNATNYIEKNLNNFITFVATVLYIALVTFII